MNERIRLLAEQAGMVIVDDEFSTYGKFAEKFSQLIVAECIQAIQNEGQKYAHPDAGEFQANNFSQAVRQHFGVES